MMLGGKSLLQGRAELVRELIHTHPEELRSVMLPAVTASALLAADPSNAQFVERDTAFTGDLSSLITEDFETDASQQVYTLHDASTAERFALYPAAPVALGTMLHRPVAISGIQLGADVALDSVTPATPSTISVGAARSLSLQAAAVAPSNTTLACSATGEQKTAVLMLQFPNNTPAFPASFGTAAWWKQAITGPSNSVNSLWSEMSAGSVYATVDVYGPLALPQSYGCADYLAMRTAALTLASKTVDLSRYTRIVLGFPETSCSFGGLADLGCNGADSIVPHPYSVVWMPIVTSYSASTAVWGSLAHELGHNLGLNHANSLDFGTVSLGPIDFQATNPGTVGGTGATTAQGAVTAIDQEYGDSFSVMGNPWVSGPGPYSAEHRAKLLGWIPTSGTANGLGTITAEGSYTIQPASTGTGLRALRVLRDSASSSWLWLEYRNGGTTLDAANLAAMKGQNLTQGAVVHYENGYGDHDKTYELDMTPTGKGNNFADGALAAGATWSDPYSSLTLKVNSITSAGLNVSVSYDSTCASFTTATDPVSAAGASSKVTVTAPSNCTWTASSNAAWMSLTGTTSGTGNGSFTWTAAANTGSGQRVTYLTVGRVSRRMIQLGGGANVVTISPANATVAPGSSSVLTLALQDTNGIADLQTVTFNAMAAGGQPCTVLASFTAGAPIFYLLEGTSGDFTSGLSAGSSGSVSTSGCTLSGKGSGIAASGSTYTLAMNLTFPASAPGVRSMYATVNSSAELPLGILNVGTVTATQTNPPTVTQPAGLKTTATTLSGTPATALPGTSIVLAVAVAGTGTTAVPTGKVALLDGTAALTTVALDGTGRASFTTALSNGAHALTAVYSGDSTFAASTSAPATVTIAQAQTTATLTASASTVIVGGMETLSVAIAHTTGALSPSGTVTLHDGSTVLTTANLSDAKAIFPLSGLASGTHTYTVVYSGDTTYLTSTSNSVAVTVGKPSATLVIRGLPVVFAGQGVTFSVTASGVTGAGVAASAPTGTVAVQENGHALGTINLDNGSGTLSVASMVTGTHTITANYGGDGNFDPSTAATTTVTVVDFSVSGPGTPADIAVKAGAITGNTATVTLTPGGTGFPIAVAFTCDGAPAQATCMVNPGTVTPGSSAVPVTVMVTTVAPTANEHAAIAGWFGLPLLGLLAHRRTRRHGLRLLAVLLVSVVALSGMTGCGAGVSSATVTTTTKTLTGGTPAGTSVLTIHATSTSDGVTLTHNATLTLQVN